MKPTNSPWGKIDIIRAFGSAQNTFIVSTPSHGGVMMPLPLAAELGIRGYGEDFHSNKSTWCCFEEDCQIAVAVLALAIHGKYDLSDEKLESCLTSIANWNPDYFYALETMDLGGLTERIRLKKEELKDVLDRIKANRKNRDLSDKMREEKHPDLIVAASRVGSLAALKSHFKNHPNLVNFQESEEEHFLMRSLEKDVEFYIGSAQDLFSHGEVVLVWTADDKRYLVQNYEIRDPNLLSLCKIIGRFID